MSALTSLSTPKNSLAVGFIHFSTASHHGQHILFIDVLKHRRCNANYTRASKIVRNNLIRVVWFKISSEIECVVKKWWTLSANFCETETETWVYGCFTFSFVCCELSNHFASSLFILAPFYRIYWSWCGLISRSAGEENKLFILCSAFGVENSLFFSLNKFGSLFQICGSWITPANLTFSATLTGSRQMGIKIEGGYFMWPRKSTDRRKPIPSPSLIT